MERHREQNEFTKTLFGVVAAAVANFGPNELKRQLTAADFVGGTPVEKSGRRSASSEKASMDRTRRFMMSITTETK